MDNGLMTITIMVSGKKEWEFKVKRGVGTFKLKVKKERISLPKFLLRRYMPIFAWGTANATGM